MDAGIALLNFGEPGTTDRDAVVTYLERIFYDNANLEEYESDEQARERARTLAERRAPGLIEEYEAIGGSPLDEQAHAQADALEAELADRGYDPEICVGMQYTEPLIRDVADRAAEDGLSRLIAVPVYPLAGPSTNVFAVDDLEAAVETNGYDVTVNSITGWHRHPTYTRIRIENLRRFVAERGLDLDDPSTELVFSAHGTPLRYLEEGSRYDLYVDEYCETMAALLGIEEYTLGFQNHANRDIPWTEPEVEEAITDVDADRIVVEPMSFLHEQSETLSELDIELAEEAEDLGLDFHRVPVPHDDPRLSSVIADVVEPFLADFDPGYFQLRQCQCRDRPGTVCLNAPLE
ncbi:MAG: ferrochelatase [Halodesulfurarchaeum sp.]